jgi:hypothetical protein
MDYVIQTTATWTNKKGLRVEHVSYFSHEIGFGSLSANCCSDLAHAKRYDFIQEARRVLRQRFGGRKDAKIIKVESLPKIEE